MPPSQLRNTYINSAASYFTLNLQNGHLIFNNNNNNDSFDQFKLKYENLIQYILNKVISYVQLKSLLIIMSG